MRVAVEADIRTHEYKHVAHVDTVVDALCDEKWHVEAQIIKYLENVAAQTIKLDCCADGGAVYLFDGVMYQDFELCVVFRNIRILEKEELL